MYRLGFPDGWWAGRENLCGVGILRFRTYLSICACAARPRSFIYRDHFAYLLSFLFFTEEYVRLFSSRSACTN